MFLSANADSHIEYFGVLLDDYNYRETRITCSTGPSLNIVITSHMPQTIRTLSLSLNASFLSIQDPVTLKGHLRFDNILP